MDRFTQNVEELLGLGGNQTLNLHIDEIRGVNTFVCIHLKENAGILEIILTDNNSSTTFDIKRNGEFIKTSEDLADDSSTFIYLNGEFIDPRSEEFVARIREILEDVQPEWFWGKMVSPFFPHIERGDVSYLQDVFGMEHIKFDFEKCSVCLNATHATTSCKHSLCFVCWSKILKSNKRCPLCRKQL
jgi:hypothetical protein